MKRFLAWVAILSFLVVTSPFWLIALLFPAWRKKLAYHYRVVMAQKQEREEFYRQKCYEEISLNRPDSFDLDNDLDL